MSSAAGQPKGSRGNGRAPHRGDGSAVQFQTAWCWPASGAAALAGDDARSNPEGADAQSLPGAGHCPACGGRPTWRAAGTGAPFFAARARVARARLHFWPAAGRPAHNFAGPFRADFGPHANGATLANRGRRFRSGLLPAAARGYIAWRGPQRGCPPQRAPLRVGDPGFGGRAASLAGGGPQRLPARLRRGGISRPFRARFAPRAKGAAPAKG